MEQNTTIKTPMQEFIEALIITRDVVSSKEEYKGLEDADIRLNLSLLIKLLNRHFDSEATRLSEAFDYGFLQAELKSEAEVTSGAEYVKKYFKKNEDISSKVQPS